MIANITTYASVYHEAECQLYTDLNTVSIVLIRLYRQMRVHQ